MPAVVNGTAHLFGISGTISNATVLDFSQDDEFANKATTEDESGNVIERRSDDITKTATITIKIQSGYSIPAVGTDLTYDSVVYEITKVGRRQKNKEHRTVELSLITSEFVSLA
jgi:hypothetical protein